MGLNQVFILEPTAGFLSCIEEAAVPSPPVRDDQLYLYCKKLFSTGISLHYFCLGIIAQGHGVCSQCMQANDALDLCTIQGQQLKAMIFCKTSDQGITKRNATLYYWQGVDDEVLLVPWGSNGRFCEQGIANEMSIRQRQTVQLYLVWQDLTSW